MLKEIFNFKKVDLDELSKILFYIFWYIVMLDDDININVVNGEDFFWVVVNEFFF